MKKSLFALLAVVFAFVACDKDDENTESTPLKVEYKSTAVSAFGAADGKIELTISGGAQPYTVNWSNGATTNTINNLEADKYTFIVKDTKNNMVTDSIDLSVPTNPSISISMGAQYANNVYVSLSEGVTKSFSRTSWDIAFETKAQSASIFTNDGSGVALYTHPTATITNWLTADTNGFSTWKPMYNDYAAIGWDNGAFNRNQLGHPDYGWGKYNTTEHSVMGDSVYFIRVASGSLKRLVIEQRKSTDNAYYIKFADIDGSNETAASIKTRDYLDRSFIHFNISENAIKEVEPAAEKWDLVFTKYMAMVMMGPSPTPYPVTGVLAKGLEIVKSDKATDTYKSLTYSSAISGIGSNWKTFNGQAYTVDTTSVYYIKKNDTYYSLRFTQFESPTGSVNFELLKK